MEKIEHKESWDGTYRGVRFEIVHWYLGWNYYLYIPVEQLPDLIKPKFNLKAHTHNFLGSGRPCTSFEYGSAPILADLEWHGGITLYEKARDDVGKIIGYKLGCDYMHLWDNNKAYNLESIVQDVHRSIDKLWELVPDLKVCCNWNGKYYPIDETYLTDKGIRVALVNKNEWDKPRFQESEVSSSGDK